MLTTPPKRKRRIILWVLLAIQVLFVIWIIAGIGSTSGQATDCGGLDQETCHAAEDAGAGIGVFFIVIWLDDGRLPARAHEPEPPVRG